MIFSKLSPYPPYCVRSTGMLYFPMNRDRLPSASPLRVARPTVIICSVVATVASFIMFQSPHAQLAQSATQTQGTNDVRSTAGMPLDSCLSILVLISSIPESALVIVDGNDSGFRAPVRLHLSGKQHDIQASADGYEPLSYQLQCVAGDSIVLSFKLRTLAPPLLVAESLGLELLLPQAILDSMAPNRKMKSYTNAAEIFTVFPLGQGIMTKVLGGDTYRKEANALMISGAVLSIGCFIVGKVLSGHQRSSIRAKNEKISRENNSVLLHNQEIDRATKLANRERKSSWEKENKYRGQVKVQKYP